MATEKKIINKSKIEIEACDETIIVESNEVTVHKLHLNVVKTAACNITVIGHQIKYCVSVKNESGVDLSNLLFKDTIDPHTSYVPGSFEVDGHPKTPTVQGHTISYKIPELKDGKTTNICFRVKVDS